MRMAIRMSIENVERGGGPFAALIVRDGELVSTGINSVADDNDPTAHAEINAIRKATLKLQRFKLNDFRWQFSIIWHAKHLLTCHGTSNSAANIPLTTSDPKIARA